MNHSLYDYLNRRTTEELDNILRYCLGCDDPGQYEDAIRMILQILAEREKDYPVSMSPESEERLSALLRKLYGDECC